MNNTTPEHEKLFDEICNKLNELSHREETVAPQVNKIEKMQTQIKKFHSDLMDTQDEFRNKIKSLETLQVSNTEYNQQLKLISDQLQAERSINSKLNADLVKSNEIALHLQLELQGVKTRAHQIQNEERKYNIQLQEKLKSFQKEVELQMVLKEEIALELNRARIQFESEKNAWLQEKEAINSTVIELRETTNFKDQQIQSLSEQIEKLETDLNEIGTASEQQGENIKTLMTVAENKIVELKMAYDKKSIESQDYYNHLQQGLTQINLLKQENASLKDYVTKVNQYMQQQSQINQQAQSVAVAVAVAAAAPPSANQPQPAK